MAIVWSKNTGNDAYKVTTAGAAVRLYRNGVLHSQWNPNQPLSGHLWELFLLSSLNRDKPLSRVLVLGCGGGAVINLIHTFSPKAKIDAVEIDKQHISVAKRFFRINKKRCNLINDDVTHWMIENQHLKYDLIIDDVFSEEAGIPYRVLDIDHKWGIMLFNMLSNQGALVINFADKKEWNKSKAFVKKECIKRKRQIMLAEHHMCDNRVIHISHERLHLDKSTIKAEKKLKRNYRYYFDKNIYSVKALRVSA